MSMFDSVTNPPTGVSESCMAFTEPLEVPVVEAAHTADAVGPNRTSLPSSEPPGESAPTVWSTPTAVSSGFPRDSAQTAVPTDPSHRTSITTSTTRPCRRSPTIRP